MTNADAVSSWSANARTHLVLHLKIEPPWLPGHKKTSTQYALYAAHSNTALLGHTETSTALRLSSHPSSPRTP
ncbi:hypothetical protein PtA15_7A283 [Puccinia triticina]|uniref:Uncharacterized protein n=1 Tax=Puccinia triticina TaxID=208348 RepID=A0ABY7CQ16_9BASI|nr:uncharacterized protein PtA15_7A283 [Puccinia triticina]WAQ86557.1 hypothetical protein PtA15_7A283 [Puccinia triticina]WAR56420.1 hypothetical protein PtB15_7B269 [Puccinia triticina]